jgi:hypothetical protein
MRKIFYTWKNFEFSRKYSVKMVGSGAGAKIFDNLEPEPELELEPHKNWPALQHCKERYYTIIRKEKIFFYIAFYSSRDASHADIVLLYTVIFHGPVQETVGGAGFEPGTAASGVAQLL